MDNENKQTRAVMQEIADVVKEKLPKGWGFFVLVFPLNKQEPRGNYVSNARREDVVATMQDFIKRNPMPEFGNN